MSDYGLVEDTTMDGATNVVYRVVALTLAARLIEAGAENVTIERSEFDALSERNIAANRGMMFDQDENRIVMRFMDNEQARADIAAQRHAETLASFSAINLMMVETLTDRIIAQGIVPDPETATWLIGILPELDAHADPNAHKAAAAVRRALDAVTPGWRALGPSDSAVEPPAAQA